MIRPICATWINSVSKKHAKWKATSSWQTGTSTFSLASKDRVFMFFQQVANLFFEILWSCWEEDEKERKLRVCKLVWGMQMKSTANRTRISVEFTKWMFLHQNLNWAKYFVCCVEGRCICCVHHFCLYLLLGPLQTSLALRRREGE